MTSDPCYPCDPWFNYSGWSGNLPCTGSPCFCSSDWLQPRHGSRAAPRPDFCTPSRPPASRPGSEMPENSTLNAPRTTASPTARTAPAGSSSRGADYGVLEFDAEAIKDWRDFDYLAIDVYLDADKPDRLVVELWDRLTKNYATRCTYEDVKLTPRPADAALSHRPRPTQRQGGPRLGGAGAAGQDRPRRPHPGQVLPHAAEGPRRRPLDRQRPPAAGGRRQAEAEGAAAAKARSRSSSAAPARSCPASRPSRRRPTSQKLTPGFVATKGLTHGGMGWPDALSGTFVVAPEGQAVHLPRRRAEGRVPRPARSPGRSSARSRPTAPSCSASTTRPSSTRSRRPRSITARSTSTAS